MRPFLEDPPIPVPPQACRDFLDVAETHNRRWQRALQHEREQRHHLEQTIEQLAKQHNSLERAWRENPNSHTGPEHSLVPERFSHPACCGTRAIFTSDGALTQIVVGVVVAEMDLGVV